MYLAFDTLNIKKFFSSSILNLINFDTYKQYCSIFRTIRIDILKKIYFLLISSLFFYYFSFLLFSFFFLRLFLISYHLHFPLLILSSLASSPPGFGFFFFFFFRSLSLRLFLSLLFFFLSLSLSLFLVHGLRCRPPQPSSDLIYNDSLGKAISIRYSQMCWRDSGGRVVEEPVAREHEEGDFGARLWVCLIWDGF